jgi:hypothetical protein
MKKTKVLISAILSLVISLCLVSCSGDKTETSSQESQASETVSTNTESTASTDENTTSEESDYVIDENADFVLKLEAIPSETEPGIINAVFTLTNIKEELSAIQFEFTYSSNTVEAVYTNNDEMEKTMTVVPMYETTLGGPAPRFEQICFFDKSKSYYRCMYVDLLSYPAATDGQTFTGMTKDGEMVITIPFKVNADASVGNVVKFDFVKDSISGTKTQGLIDAKGDGASVSYTLAEKDIVK